VGQLASNAVKLLPKNRSGNAIEDEAIGAGARMMDRLRAQVNAQRARQLTLDQLQPVGGVPSLANGGDAPLMIEQGATLPGAASSLPPVGSAANANGNGRTLFSQTTGNLPGARGL
jgi:hypothetical protein